jgi:putative ABC transport system permease protein
MDWFGKLWLLVRKSLRQHALSTVVTALAIALASGLVMSVFAIQKQTRQAFAGGDVGFDAVLGARGSQLQLVLNTVFHLETSPGNLPWSAYQEIKNNPSVQLAIPYAVGDNYQGFRIVGTTEDIFNKFEFQQGKKFQVQPGGRFFQGSNKEAVIGSFVAQQTGLKTGDVFQPYHGLIFDEKQKHNDDYTVVGVLEPTNSPSDRVMWIPIEGIYRMTGHVLRGTGETYTAKEGETIPDEAKEVSAVMLKFRSPQTGFQLDQLINRQGKVATLAFPIGRTMAELFDKIGWLNRVLELVAYLVVVVAAGSILASIYNTINERRREFAILRALGAKRTTVFSAIVLEAAIIAAVGTLVGFLVYWAILSVTSYIVRQQTGVVLNVFKPDWLWLTVPLLMIAVGAVAGLLPALKAYRTDVAENLTPIS